MLSSYPSVDISYITHILSSSLRDLEETYVLCNFSLGFLSNHLISVRVNSVTSEPFPYPSGIPQEAIYLSNYFPLFINVILISAINTTHSYVDDNPACLRMPLHLLSSDFDRISNWGNQNLVNFSAKTHFLPVSLSTMSSEYDIPFLQLLFWPYFSRVG